LGALGGDSCLSCSGQDVEAIDKTGDKGYQDNTQNDHGDQNFDKSETPIFLFSLENHLILQGKQYA
jgi:hypothetical protein